MGYREGGITGQRTEGADHPRPTAGSPHPRAQPPVPQGDGGARRPPQEAGGRADAAGPARCQVRAPPSRSGGCQRAGRTERGSESFTRSLRGARGLLRRHLVSRCGAPHCCCCWWWCCHGGGAVLRVAGLQDGEIRPDTEPAGRAAAPPAAARCLGLPARVRASGSFPTVAGLGCRDGLIAPHRPVPRWVLVVRRGYQDTDAAPHVSVITKMKGVSVTQSKDASSRLWDVVDYASPPQVGTDPSPGPDPSGSRVSTARLW